MEAKNAKAYDMALACRLCRTATDYEFDKEDNVWVTRCECGKTDYIDPEIVEETVNYLAKAMNRITKR